MPVLVSPSRLSFSRKRFRQHLSVFQFFCGANFRQERRGIQSLAGCFWRSAVSCNIVPLRRSAGARLWEVMKHTAACAMNIRSESLSFRACGASGSSLRSCSPPITGGHATFQFEKIVSFTQSLSFESTGFEYSAGGACQSSSGAVPRRWSARNLHSMASFPNGRCGGKDIPVGILHCGSNHNRRVSVRMYPEVGVDYPGRCPVDHQAASAAGLGNAVVLVGQPSWSRVPLVLTAEDSPRHLSSFGKADLDIASQKSLVLPEKASNVSKQLCVAVDVDEVLGSFLATLNLFIEETYSVHHDISEYYIYDFMKVWNCSQVEANLRVHAFFDSDHFKHGISPIPGAHQTLLQLVPHCQLVVVTSRQHIIKDRTLEWIERYYAGIFKEVHFGNHFALEGRARPKSEICRSLGAHVLIDDNPRYAIDCAQCGIEVLLFDLHGDYPWSKTPCGPQHPLITRVKDWQEVQQALLARTCAEL